MENQQFLSTQEAADYLGLSTQTLIGWRSGEAPQGPPFHRLGLKVRYKLEDLESWVESRRVDPEQQAH